MEVDTKDVTVKAFENITGWENHWFMEKMDWADVICPKYSTFWRDQVD